MIEKKIEVIIPVNIFVENSLQNVYEYARNNEFTANYATSELLNNSGNDVGDVKFNLLTITNIGGLNTNFTAVYKFNDNCNCNEYFAYVSGIIQYEFVTSGNVIVNYENAIVTSFVKNNKVIPNVEIKFILDSDNKLISVFTY